MDNTPSPLPPELTALARHFAQNYRFSEIESSQDELNNSGVASVIENDLGDIAHIAERGGMTREAIYETMGSAFAGYPEGTDLDAEHGASMAHVSEEVQKTMLKEIEAKYGKRIAAYAKARVDNPNLNTAYRQDLIVLSAIYADLNSGTIEVGVINALTEEEFDAAFEHAKNMTAPGDEFNIEAFTKALAAVKKGGIDGLRKYEKSIGWEV